MGDRRPRRRRRWCSARWTSRRACAWRGLSALTIAEYFRDVKGQDVLLFIDNIFRFVQAGSEVSTLLGRMPSAVGYQPTLADEMGELQERITSTRGVRSPRCRPSTCPPTTTPTRRRSRRSPTSTPPPSCPETSPRWASTRPWTAGLDVDHPPARRGGQALRRGSAGAGDPAALQGAAGHHRHPRPRRAVRGGQGDGGPGPQDPAVPVAAHVRGAELHRVGGSSLPWTRRWRRSRRW